VKNPLHKFVAARQSDTLLVYCYDVIGATMFGDGITASAVADKLGSVGNFNNIEMRINSPGGDPFEAIAISNLLKSLGKPINVTVDGLAASAASVLAMAGNSIQIADNGMVMIHNAAAATFGDAQAMRAMADTLDKVSGTLVDTYVARTGLQAGEVKAMMAAETWMSASEAVAKGFADSIVNADGHGMSVAASFDLRGFRNIPVALQKEQYSAEELKRLRLRIV
jgi:ATP-dependent Clp protease protease subunit